MFSGIFFIGSFPSLAATFFIKIAITLWTKFIFSVLSSPPKHSIFFWVTMYLLQSKREDTALRGVLFYNHVFYGFSFHLLVAYFLLKTQPPECITSEAVNTFPKYYCHKILILESSILHSL